MLSKLTLIGLNEYSDGHLWDLLILPEGIDKESFINECLRQGGEFPLLYPDLDFCKVQIGEFSRKWYKNFERWYKAYSFEYEALFNLDVTSTITEEGEDHKKGKADSNGGANDTVTHQKAAYDSGTFQNTAQDVSGGTNEMHSTNNDDSTHKVVTTEVRQGNQGITMSQEMLLAEFNAWLFNLYNHMAEVFINEFCICIYS